MFNKYGYSDDVYIGEDLVGGDGDFTDASKWTMSSANISVDNGSLQSIASGTKWAINLRTVSYTTSDKVCIEFTITEGSGTVGILEQTNNIVLTAANYDIGTHTVTFTPSRNGTQIRIYTTSGIFRLDNFIIDY